MANTETKKPSQSEKIRNFLSEVPSDYTFTVTKLTKDLKDKVPGLTNGGVSGFVAKLAQRGILKKLDRKPGDTAYTFKVAGDPLGYNTRSTATVGSLPGRTLKHKAAEFIQAESLSQEVPAIVDTPVEAPAKRTQQDIMDDMVTLMAELGQTAVIDLTTVSTEAMLAELMERATRKETE